MVVAAVVVELSGESGDLPTGAWPTEGGGTLNSASAFSSWGNLTCDRHRQGVEQWGLLQSQLQVVQGSIRIVLARNSSLAAELEGSSS